MQRNPIIQGECFRSKVNKPDFLPKLTLLSATAVKTASFVKITCPYLQQTSRSRWQNILQMMEVTVTTLPFTPINRAFSSSFSFALLSVACDTVN
jgi:hypothetical protein